MTIDLRKLAEEVLGKERAGELHTDIEQLAVDLEKLRQVPLDPEDEP